MKIIETIKQGDKYEYLTLTGNGEYRLNGILYVEAICVCSRIKYFVFSALVKGKTKSCGCKMPILLSSYKVDHACHRRNEPTHPIYNSYNGMKKRCYNVDDKAYVNYGGRGIKICKEWLISFKDFLKWSLENGWERGLSIERIDNNKNYCPNNCKRATRLEQNRNQRKNIFITAFYETKCLSEWILDSRCKIGIRGLSKRVKGGWNHEKAIITPNLKKAA